jgi:hypothetical protein
MTGYQAKSESNINVRILPDCAGWPSSTMLDCSNVGTREERRDVLVVSLPVLSWRSLRWLRLFYCVEPGCQFLLARSGAFGV